MLKSHAKRTTLRRIRYFVDIQYVSPYDTIFTGLQKRYSCAGEVIIAAITRPTEYRFELFLFSGKVPILGAMSLIGELAGLAAAFLWALTSIFFAQAGRLIGSYATNKIRILLGVFLYAGFSLIFLGSLFPQSVNMAQLFWLGLSGIAGLIIGDGTGFKALVMIGPRLTSLLYSSAPVITTIIAWIFLKEQLKAIDLLGIALTIGGISWVVLERRHANGNHFNLKQSHPDKGSLLKGVLLGVVAATGQAVGLVLAKQGMSHADGTVDPLQAAYIRMSTALVGIWLYTILKGQLPETITAIKNKKALAFCMMGAIVGPFLGVWMSLVAIAYIPTGVAATLNSTTPVLILPLVAFWYKEKITFRAVFGAIITVIGIAVIFLFS